jgi:hypothetical protein
VKEAEHVEECRLSRAVGAYDNAEVREFVEMDVAEGLEVLKTNRFDLHRVFL